MILIIILLLLFQIHSVYPQKPLLASLEFQHPNPKLLLNTTSLLQTNIALTLAVPNTTIQLTNMYYSIYKNMYYPLTPTAPYSSNSTINIRYNIIDPPQTILDMGIIEFNTLMAKSEYIINYSRLIEGSDYIIAAGPVELLHLPSIKPYPSNQQQSSATTQTVLSIYKYLILYILITAVYIEIIH